MIPIENASFPEAAHSPQSLFLVIQMVPGPRPAPPIVMAPRLAGKGAGAPTPSSHGVNQAITPEEAFRQADLGS